MAKFTSWLDGLINRIAPLQSTGDYPAQIQRAQDRMDTLDRLADTEPDSLRAAAYRSVWRTMGEELGFIVADLDRGRLNDEALAAAVEQWESYGRAYLAQNAISADSVFPQSAAAAYDPASDVAIARTLIRGDLREAEAKGDQHRAAVLRDFDAQLDKMVELYTLQAADHRSQDREETPDLDREVFRREMGEHAAYFSGKVHPGREIRLPYDVLPALSAYHPGLWERYEQVFSVTMDWASKVRHPILDSTHYGPPVGAVMAVRDHAAAVHAWALAEAKQAGADGRTARQEALYDFADDVAMVLSQYEHRAAARPSQVEADDLTGLDLATFTEAVDHVAGLGNEILTEADQLVLPDQLRADAVDRDAQLTQRRDELFPHLSADDNSADSADALIDYLDDVDSWLALAPPDLGHKAVLDGLSQQADRAVSAGDLTEAARYRDMMNRIQDTFVGEEWAAVEKALGADDRRASISQSRAEIQTQLAAQLDRHGLDLPGETSDATDVQDRYDDRVIEHAVRHAYDMIVGERRAERAFDLEAPSDDAPVPVAQLHDRIASHATASGAPGYSTEQIDAALRRLTARQSGARAELLDHDHRGEQRATVRIIDATDTDSDAAEEVAHDVDELSAADADDAGDELGRSGQAAGAETAGTSNLSQEDLAKWRDRLTASVMEEAARSEERLWSSSMFINVASPPVTAHTSARETGTDRGAEARIFQPRVDFDSWLDQTQQHQVEQGDDVSDAARRELDADLEAAEYNDPQRRDEALAREADDLAATADSSGDAERAGRLRILASETRHVPYDWDGESAITSEPWQVEASEAAEVEVSAAREAAARESADKVEQDDEASVEQSAPAGEELDQGDVDDRGDDAAEKVTAATETSACSVAISRAQRSVKQVHERVETDQQARDERDDELARWHAEDRAAEAADEQAIEDTGPALGDDQQV
jgi:hypothetical protein